MKKLAIMLCVVASVVCANAKILRVSNINGSTAPYSSVEDALKAAKDGDVIMLDASPKSYGEIRITKRITLQGPGFFLQENGNSHEGATNAYIQSVAMEVDGINLISLKIRSVYAKNHSNWIINRCCIDYTIEIDRGATHGIIHQNYITGGIFITYPSVSFMQVTNNIIYGGINAMYDSVFKYNTFVNASKLENIGTSVFENNIGIPNLEKKTNTIENNVEIPKTINYNKETDIDIDVEEKDALISKTHGAFAGEDPYVISGIAPGPYIEDIYVPVSVAQGDDMKVTLKIGTSR